MKHTVSKRKKAFLVLYSILCLSVVATSFSSCFNYTGYRGRRSDLYTVAVNNIFGISGFKSNGEAVYDPSVRIIDTDDYGRTLFFYSEYYNRSSDPEIDYGMAFVISQKREGKYVYYYQDDCYLPYFATTGDSKEAFKNVSQDSIEELKEKNDWNKKFNEDKCTKARRTTKKPKGKLRLKNYEFDDAVYSYAKANGYKGTDKRTCQHSIYCNSDTSGKELYYIFCTSSDDYGNGEKVFESHTYAVIVNPDKSFSDSSIVEITDVQTYYEKIRVLKQQNGWNQKS